MLPQLELSVWGGGAAPPVVFWGTSTTTPNLRSFLPAVHLLGGSPLSLTFHTRLSQVLFAVN